VWAKSIAVVLFLCAVSSALADTALDECWKKSKNRLELGACLQQLRRAADARLARVGSDAWAVQAGLDEIVGSRQASRNLARVETAFSLYRELECYQRELQMGSGSGSGDAFSSCWIDMTRDRVTALELLMPDEAARVVVPEELEGTNWVVADIGGQRAARDIESKLTFQAGSGASGNSGCNGFQTAIEVRGTAVHFGPVAGTRMICSPAAMEQEGRFLAALASARRLERRGRLLFAYSERPEPAVRFWQRSEVK
jgi:heat shock protein HslJ